MVLRERLTNNFVPILVIALLIGLFVPGIEYLPRWSGLALIAGAIFFSCSRVTMDELRQIDIKHALSFFVVRYLLYPLPVFFAFQMLAPDYAVGALLLLLAPAGASAAAVSMIVRGNASLSLSATMVTNALAPFYISGMMYLAASSSVQVDAGKMLFTLLLGVIVPALLYFFLVRRVEKIKLMVRREAPHTAMLCVAAMVCAAVAQGKEQIFTDPLNVFYMVVASTIIYALSFLVARVYAMRLKLSERLAYMVCSGGNNNGLIIGLALLYFPPEVVIFCVLTEIPWVMGVAFIQQYAKRVS